MPDIHKEDLEQESTHATDEARMILPGVQAILGFQLVAVFNRRFEMLSEPEQWVHLAAFFLVALAMGLLMTPAAYHRQVERGAVSREFVDLASTLLSLALMPLIAGLAIDAYLLVRLVAHDTALALACAIALAAALAGLWFGLPQLARRQRDRR